MVAPILEMLFRGLAKFAKSRLVANLNVDGFPDNLATIQRFKRFNDSTIQRFE